MTPFQFVEGYVNYPQTKDLRASDFIADCP